MNKRLEACLDSCYLLQLDALFGILTVPLSRPIPSASNDMHCSTDANICLQVSAISFSLSMKSDAIGEEKIW
jgi:hypothetical protein